eukprot:TRINITY_DN6427_c0_g1_i1.p1 TRINITY_DN6427_c0_g1~~TRINITY_DN6427_c0_g1_i1.p1  ORF type:complete len:438 (+),score=123.63 TRINITY_DN6427_c0_g1_i1:60-1316(+)
MSGPSQHATRVGHSFVSRYYSILNSNPSELHRFYKHDSVFTFSDAHLQKQSETIQGVEGISEKLQQLDLQNNNVEISHIESQESQSGGFLIVVLGNLYQQSAIKPFMECFFLAEQKKGYYVRNDVLRYMPIHNTPSAYPSYGNVQPAPIEEKQNGVHDNGYAQSDAKSVEDVVVSEKEASVEQEIAKPVDSDIKKIQKDEKTAPAKANKSQAKKADIPDWAAEDVDIQGSVPNAAPQQSTWASRLSKQASIAGESTKTQEVKKMPEVKEKSVKQSDAGKPTSSPKPHEDRTIDEHSIYVKNMPYTVQQEEINRVFSQFGAINSITIQNLSRGYIFVKYESTKSASDAIAKGNVHIHERQVAIEKKIRTGPFGKGYRNHAEGQEGSPKGHSGAPKGNSQRGSRGSGVAQTNGSHAAKKN